MDTDQFFHLIAEQFIDRISKEWKANNMKPIVGISMGDPFGNGPEITVKVLSDPEVFEWCRPLVIGDAVCLEYAAEVQKTLGNEPPVIHKVSSPAEAEFKLGVIDVLDMDIIKREDIPGDPSDPAPFMVGHSKLGGEAGFRYVEKMINMALEHEIDATVTNAISKEAINMAGHHYSGHTEIYADMTGTKNYAMVLAHENLRVIHVSTHVSLREACDRVKYQRELDVIRLADQTCKKIGIEDPKIGVAGLNPHCGENGMFGREEIEEIQPAIDQAMKEGINIPDGKASPPDSIFSKAIGGWYDMVVVQYHDQGHIPLKVKGFVYNREAKRWESVSGINVSVGMPIVRVSVDHGTGFDTSGSGTASPASLKNAIDFAVRMAE